MTIYSGLLPLANRLADASGPIIRRYFRAGLAVDHKTPDQPVTRADQEAEAAIRAILAEARPDDGFFGEETGASPGRGGYTWVVDPIDGTKAFVCGKPIFGTLIALLDGDTPVLGVIDQPVLSERWVGATGQPTLFNGAPVRTRAITALAEARLGTTSPYAFNDGQRAAFDRLAAAASITTHGGDCYSYALIALGTLDIVAEANLKLYDFAALIPVIEGAGGIVTNWRGERVGRRHDGTILAAANPALHAAALAILNP